MDRRFSAKHPETEFALRIGLPVIDRQHAELVGRLEHLNAEREAQPGGDAFSLSLSRLGLQIGEHFDTEEGILRSCGMPDDLVREHVQAHTEILEQYARLNIELMAGMCRSREETLGLIRRWVVEHVLTHDSRIRDYLPQRNEGAKEP